MIPLESENTYHIYNRANGREQIFVNNDNYQFFLHQYKLFVSPFTDTYSYCLMPNHFHFIIRIRNEKEALEAFQKDSPLPKFKTLNMIAGYEKFISKQFSNLFSSYAQAFNKQQSRKGSLFMKNFKRKKITNEKYLTKLVHYIHYNPIEAGLCSVLTGWKYSSYNAFLVDHKQTMLKKEEVIGWFGDKENFIYCHRYPPKLTGIE